MENEILRKITDADKIFIDVDLNKPKRQKTTRESFTIKLHEEEQKATGLHLPFARHAAKDDFEEQIKSQMKSQMKEFGSVEHPEKLVVPKMDWKQYSDLKNFKTESEEEKFDTNLSNKNPGLSVMLKSIVYKYKDYGNVYRVMEEPQEAINRAQQKVWKAQEKSK